ncbi:MAG: hypothetical protein QOG55_194 [Acidobacteriaceae bacterium]|jgi:2-methylcitrate dehydratase PrpD|nr:hypothetical protein [Acidobacteriaceae bacterium]
MEPITRTLIHFSHALKFEDLSAEIVQQTKCLLLDYLGVTIAGARTESAQAVYSMLKDTYSLAPGPCTIIGTSARSSPEHAALANGTASHSVELDDTHQAGSIHLGTVMFSVAIALSEIRPEIDTEQFVAAVVAGYEVSARLAMALQPKLHYQLGFHPTATCGVFGAAVTAARLLHLSEDQMLSSVGIAGSMAAGSLDFYPMAPGPNVYIPAWPRKMEFSPPSSPQRGFADLRASWKGAMVFCLLTREMRSSISSIRIWERLLSFCIPALSLMPVAAICKLRSMV